MKKLGVISNDAEADSITSKEFDKFLSSTMQPQHFAAVRDIFPLANGLSDDQLLQIACQGTQVGA